MRYICDKCGCKCNFASNGGELPTTCPYGKAECAWEKCQPLLFEKDDKWRHPYYDDEEYIANLDDEQKNEIIRNHFDCHMQDGCPCFLDKDYKCEEWKAYCHLTGSDGSDFEFDDCWFRSNEHRCLTDYVLWKMKNGKGKGKGNSEKD